MSSYTLTISIIFSLVKKDEICKYTRKLIAKLEKFLIELGLIKIFFFRPNLIIKSCKFFDPKNLY